MNWRFINYTFSLVLLSGVVLTSCLQSDYTRLVKSELAKGIRQDSILLGIKLGDTRNDFYGRCFDLNKQQLVTQGPQNSSVQYVFKDSSVHQKSEEIRLLFYPAFDKNNVITNMDMEFSYTGWSPWNKSLQSDSLKVKTMELLMKWYGGNEFITAEINKKEVPVKLDANRRMLVYIKDSQSVLVRVQDILHPTFKHSISVGEVEKVNK